VNYWETFSPIVNWNVIFSWSYLVDLSLREWTTAGTASSSSRTSMVKSKQGVSGMTTL
jgi:hypothetical protein